MSHHRTTPKQARIFFARACAMLERVGARRLRHQSSSLARTVCGVRHEAVNGRAEYELMTIHGRLVLDVYDDWIPARFDESVDRPDCPGGRIGKWNHHYSFERTTDLEHLDAWLASLAGRLLNIAGPRREPGALARYAQPLRYRAPEPQSREAQLEEARRLLAVAEAQQLDVYTWREGEINEETRMILTARDQETPVKLYSVDPFDVEKLQSLLEDAEAIQELRRVVARLEERTREPAPL